MDQKVIQFLYLNGLVVLALIIYLLRRPKNRMSRLKLKKVQDLARSAPDGDVADANFRHERPLNVIFQYNGHDFDAYEILGVPAGSHWPAVETAYDRMVKTCQAGDDEIYHHAFNAIRRSVSGQ